MKKFNKVFLSLVSVLILALPMLTGCSLFGNNVNNNQSNNNQQAQTSSNNIVFNYKTYSKYHTATESSVYLEIEIFNDTNNSITLYENDFSAKVCTRQAKDYYVDDEVHLYTNDNSLRLSQLTLTASEKRTVSFTTKNRIDSLVYVDLKIYYKTNQLVKNLEIYFNW